MPWSDPIIKHARRRPRKPPKLPVGDYPLLTMGQAARLLAQPRVRVEGYVRCGLLRGIALEGRTYVPARALREFLKARGVPIRG